MPTLNQYKALSITPPTHTFCSALIFFSLLEKFQNLERFVEHFTRLFGEQGMMAKIVLLQANLVTYQNNGTFPASLPSLVQQHFLPKLAAHLRTRGQTFLQQALWGQIEPSAQQVERGQMDALAQQALADLLQIQVQVYTQSAQRLSLSATIGTGGSSAQVVKEGEQYQPLVNIESLLESQRQGLTTVPTYSFQPTPAGLNTRESFTEEALSELVRQTMAELPKQLAAISASIPQEPVFQPLVAATELSLVRLDYPNSSLPLRDLTNADIELSALYKAYDAVVTLTRKHPVESVWTWSRSMGRTVGVGAAGGTLGLGVAAGVAELVVAATGGLAGAGAAAVCVACIPVFATSTLLTLVGGAVGKGYAQAYKEALKAACQHINEQDYEAAVAVLDKEFNRFIANRTLRRPFLTNAHYAVAHFFRGMCAEMLKKSEMPDGNVKKAYVEYQQALVDAKKTNENIVILLLHMKLIQLLRKHGSALVSSKEQPDALIQAHLDELNRHFNPSLTHFYWQALKNMAAVATHCYQATPFSELQLIWIKGVLEIQSLFMLEGYQEGRGNYLQVFYAFFHTLTRTYFHLKHPEQLATLDIPFENETHAARYVVEKLAEVFSQFNAFRESFPTLARQSAFQRSHAMMKHFTLQFTGMSLNKLKKILNPAQLQDALQGLASRLDVRVQDFYAIADKHERTTAFLMKIEAEFGLHFVSIQAWLEALIEPSQTCFQAVNAQTQNTMLHMLAQLPENFADAALVTKAAQRMREKTSSRNHGHHTPLSLLAEDDAYGIKAEINPPKLIPLGRELNEVDEFVARIERNVGAEGHFLLLQGPPGTGKTEAVLTHLRSKNHKIVEWEGGSGEDKWVGQLSHRVKQFFHEAKQNCSSQATVLFIDEMSGVCPEVSGNVANGSHNSGAVVDEFQKQISALKGHNIVLIGATNYPERLSKAIQNRMTRIIFPIPDQVTRRKLLNHLLREKCISEKLITKVVDLTQGWSPRQLAQMIESIEEAVVLEAELSKIFEKSRAMAQNDFRTEFKAAHLILPQFEVPAPSTTKVQSDSIDSAFTEIMQSLTHPELYNGRSMHMLLYGPPGSGKTTAIREFARDHNCPFFLVESATTPQDFISIFERAKSYTLSIICIDEIDQLACDSSRVRVFLQEQMDGLIANRFAIVGATNYPEQIAEPILSRFAQKIPVPLPTPAEVGFFIQQEINASMTKIPNIQMDAALQQEMKQRCVELGRLSASLSYRDLSNAFSSFFARIALQRASVVSREALVKCIQDALDSTREAVLATSRQMAAPRYRGQLFREAANMQGSTQPAAASVSPHAV